MSPFDLRVLSLGAGVQSTTLYLLAARGELENMPDVAIFADTKQEPPWVYENLERLRKLHGERIPIDVVTAGDLGDAVARKAVALEGRFASVPFWVASEGQPGLASPGRRQCTREYKIDVVKRRIRERLGLLPRQRAKGRYRVEEWIGISLDEAHRAKPSRTPWITTRWPLLMERPMRREDCKRYLRSIDYPVPGKSACIFCPYRQTIEYARWRDEEPELFAEACRVDDLIRRPARGMRQQQYVSRLLMPLREIPTAEELSDTDDSQIDLFGNECEGICGV